MCPSYLFKVITVGSASVGKTSIILRYTTGTFREYYAPTLGADFATKQMTIDSNSVKLQIWDLGGQVFLQDVRAKFYNGARGVVYMFDVTRRDTLEDMQGWIKEVNTHLKNHTSLVVANKTDLESERVVSTDEGKKLAETIGAEYIETSVKLNEGVADTFTKIAHQIVDDVNSE
ncbi:MAG: Rab family GTPase [Candidatus Thorarchaeota archaeon]